MIRPILGILGLAVLAACWLGPLTAMAQESFAAHMTLHVLLVAVAPPLLALSLAGPPFQVRLPAVAVFLPIPASILELIVVWGWHTPGLNRLARESQAGFAAEQVTFLLAGLLVWGSVFLSDRSGGARQAASGAFGLIMTSMHMTLLGVVLALGPLPFYGGHHGGGGGEAVDFLGMTLNAMEDQHLGGAIMLAVGGTSYLIGGLYLVGRLLSGGEERSGTAPRENQEKLG